ncbi:MAG: FMN-binding protein [Pirellulales bacterium]
MINRLAFPLLHLSVIRRQFSMSIFVAALLFACSPALLFAADVVEFLSGAKMEGKVIAIRKSEKQLDFQSSIAGRSIERTYTYAKIHAITLNGKRYLLNEKPMASSDEKLRTERDVLKLIEEAGSTQPDWYDSTELNYPASLDLSWPQTPPQKGWNNQKNMGQYIWDVINPNPGRWQSGVKLVHLIMGQHKSSPALLKRDMQVLAGMYFRLFQDYPRAAFWFKKSGVSKGSRQGVNLAECYWRLGNKKMALDMLNARSIHSIGIKLFGDMGETKRALEIADTYAKAGSLHEAYLLAGDACRVAQQDSRAISYYQKVIDAKKARNEESRKRHVARAQESIEAIRFVDQAKPATVADGTYKATTTGYNGMIEVQVKVASGKLETVKVIKHREKQFYAALTDTPKQLINHQSVEGIDATSGATITSQAIVNATAKAMADAPRR